MKILRNIFLSKKPGSFVKSWHLARLLLATLALVATIGLVFSQLFSFPAQANDVQATAESPEDSSGVQVVTQPIEGSEEPSQNASGHKAYLPAVSKTNWQYGAPWRMAGANPARTSWTPTEVRGSLKPAWYTHLDAYISQKVQIIASDGFLYISTAKGLYAFDAATGRQQWVYSTSLPLGHSPTIANGVAYVGGFDNKLHAIDAFTGQQIWTFTAGAGFHTNPLVVEGLVFAGNRDGNFYAVHAGGPNAGQLAWKYETDGPVLYSAAYKNGVVYFASNDNHAYALKSGNGELVWKSAKLPGHGFHSWWPVVYKDFVIFAGSYNYRYADPFRAPHTTLEREQVYPTSASDGDPIGLQGNEPGGWINGTKTINASAIVEYFQKYPHRRTYFVLNRANGQEFTFDHNGSPGYAPILWFGTHSGTRFPPIVAGDGVLYQSNNLFYNQWIPRGKISGWKIGTPIISERGPSTAVDEPVAYAAGGNMIYWKRCCDRVAGGYEIFRSNATVDDLESWNYYDEGGRMLRRTLPDLFEKGWEYAYWKHGDQSPPIPYNGKVYVIANNAIVAFAPEGMSPILPSEANTGEHTGENPADIERERVIPGINSKVTLSNNTWPLLIQQETYYNTDSSENSRGRWFRLFEVAGSVAASPTSLAVQEGALASVLTSTFEGSHTLTTWVSSRAPATLYMTSSNVYQLNGSFAGLAYPTSTGIKVKSGSVTIAGSELSEGWLLVWDNADRHRWSPVVLTLERRPSQITFGATGLTLSYSGVAGYLATTPLYGMSHPNPGEDSSWLNGLPQEKIERVQLLDRIARAFPNSVNESWSINGNKDATFSFTYNYTQFSGEWNTAPLPLALLPSHTALAAWNGSPIMVNGKPLGQQLDLNYVTPLGRVAGVPNTNTMTVVLPGIAKYWRDKPASTVNPLPGDPVRDKLIAEISKMLAAGHLLPGYGIVGIWESKGNNTIGDILVDYWKNPADTIYTLLRALPWLPPDMQQQVLAYVQNEYQAYPLHKTAHIGWDIGKNRNRFDLPPEIISEGATIGPKDRTGFNGWGLPPQNFYSMWMYAEKFGNASKIFADSGDKLDLVPQYKNSMPYVLNSYVIGYIGYLRLAEMAGAGPQTEIEKTTIETLVLRAALSKYPEALAQTGFEYGGYQWVARKFMPEREDTLFNAALSGSVWSQLPLYGFPVHSLYGLSGASTGGDYAFAIDFVNLAPELGNFMRDYTRNESEAMIASYTRRAPYWFVAEAEEAGGEGVFQPLYDRVSIFQAKALILKEGRSELEKYIDIPAVAIGDLFYTQNLIAVLESKQ